MKRNILKLSIILTVLSGFVLSACTAADDETVIVPKTVDQYKSEMAAFIASEKNIVNTCVVGYNKGDFKTATTFDAAKADYLTALAAAEAILNKQGLTITEIINANKALSTQGKAFVSNLWISDRRSLNDAIVAAETLNTATLVGTTTGTVTQVAKDAFTTAITAAKAVRGSSVVIERQVADGVLALDTAKKAFEAAIIK